MHNNFLMIDAKLIQELIRIAYDEYYYWGKVNVDGWPVEWDPNTVERFIKSKLPQGSYLFQKDLT